MAPTFDPSVPPLVMNTTSIWKLFCNGPELNASCDKYFNSNNFSQIEGIPGLASGIISGGFQHKTARLLITIGFVALTLSLQRTCGVPTWAKEKCWRKVPSSPLTSRLPHPLTILTCLLTSPPPSPCWWASSSRPSPVRTANPPN